MVFEAYLKKGFIQKDYDDFGGEYYVRRLYKTSLAFQKLS